MAEPKPYLQPAIQEALKKMSTGALLELFKKSPMMAHPAAEPWPYGTILRLKDSPNTIRIMYLGGGREVRITGGASSANGHVYDFPATTWDRWEPADD